MKNPKKTDKTRMKLLEAAAAEFHHRGFKAASLNDILARTNLTKGALYHHFPNKTALGYAVVEELLAQKVESQWIRPLETAEDPIACLKEQLTAFGLSAGEEDVLLGCPLNNLAQEMSPVDEGFRLRVMQIYDRWRNVLAGALRRGQARGSVRPDIEPERVSTFIVGAMAGCRGLAKNAQSRELMSDGMLALDAYWEAMRP